MNRWWCVLLVLCALGPGVAAPVVFADDFMRTSNKGGPWTVRAGVWGLQSPWDADPQHGIDHFAAVSYAQNPFAWAGHSRGDGPALCTVGEPAWGDYTFTVAVRPGDGGAVGLVVNRQADGTALLVRWSPANDRGPTGNRLVIARLAGEAVTVLASSPGGYVPGQWYKLTVDNAPGSLRVAVDNQERARWTNDGPARGQVGLYVEGQEGAVFDDVTVYGHGLNTALIAEQQAVRLNDRFAHDREMQGWADAGGDWLPWPGEAHQWVYRRECYGAHGMALTLTPRAGADGLLWLTLCGDGQAPLAGYRLEVQRGATETRYTLCRNTAVLATKKGPALNDGADYTLRFAIADGRLRLTLDGAPLLTTTDLHALTGIHPAYRAEGSLANVRDVVVTGANLLDYTFSTAPVDWVTEGTWMPAVRWACAPQWSFLGGWSRGDVVLWHKGRFAGDQAIEAFVGEKMTYPREHQMYEERTRELAVTLCGDGSDPRSGYAAILGAPGADGTPNQRTVLQRNGVVVASAPGGLVQAMQGTHHAWFHLVLRRQGNTVDFRADYTDAKQVHTAALTYTDPHPLEGGVPAVWSRDNGIVIARVRLAFAQPPQPRTETRAVIAEPFYPEWANVDQPLTLDYACSWSTSGRPVVLQATPLLVPPGDGLALAVEKLTVRFRPQQPGEHWYRLRAVDGNTASPATHLALPVFTPALGRDDRHALVCYRFDEGSGTVVRDHGTGAPADLAIPADAHAAWLPGQGLTYDGPAPLATPGAVRKLAAIAAAKACTVECWISAATIVPRTDGTGCLVSWGAGNTTRNFAVDTWWRWLALIPPGAVVGPATSRPYDYWITDLDHEVFRTSLHHYAVTWDGTTTRVYRDGKCMGANPNRQWNPEKWHPDRPLLLGNQDDRQTNYQGTYYLLAIHDKCFTEAEVLRHYRAGPSAR